MLPPSLSFVLSALSLVKATPVLQENHERSIADYIRAATNTPAGDATSTAEPCAQISNALVHNVTKLDPSLSLQCLRSVPLDKEGDLVQLKGIKTAVEFQSTLVYLKDPPRGYFYPPVDVQGGLEALEDTLRRDGYDNEFDFQLDLYTLIASAHDGHFTYKADILSVFTWYLADSLNVASVSKDSIALPELYQLTDIPLLSHNNASTNAVSPIVRIAGIEVESFLNQIATQRGLGQDPDANYNSLFPIVPLESFGLDGTGLSGRLAFSDTPISGNDTTVDFANGTSRRYTNFAFTNRSFKGVHDGKSFFKKFCTPHASSTPPQPMPVNITQKPYQPIPANVSAHLETPPFFPKPVALLEQYGTGGYFPEENPDLAVLSIPTFSINPNDTLFENTVRQFLATARAANKKRLVIDLRGNPGGDVFLAYDLFKQLFPDKSPLALSNLRASQLLDDFGKATTAQFRGFNYSSVPESQSTYFGLFLDGRGLENSTGKEFKDWQTYFGPHNIHGGNFTTLQQYNLSSAADTATVDVYGYSFNDTAPQPQTFEADNIVMLLDGFCASTCTIFAELMKTQAGVKQVAVGGRKQTGPMQGVGGVKGSNVLELPSLPLILETVIEAVPKVVGNALNSTYGAGIRGLEHALARYVAGSINLRNNIRPGDTSETPLQFVYEASDCRFFYTPSMYLEQSLVWSKTYQVMWQNGTCVPGSTGQPSSLPGADQIGDVPHGNTSASTSSGMQPMSSTTSLPSPPPPGINGASNMLASGAFAILAGVINAAWSFI